MQILHPMGGSLQEYLKAVQCHQHAQQWNPCQCPMCRGRNALVAHGFYQRSVVDQGFDRVIRIYRYLCRFCRRTVSLLPEFLLPYQRFSITLLGRFLQARLLEGKSLREAAVRAGLAGMPYQRGQYWIRRFVAQAAALGVAMTALTRALPATSLVCRALSMLQAVGWIAAHRFLFSELRMHLLGWPAFLTPTGQCRKLRPGWPPLDP